MKNPSRKSVALDCLYHTVLVTAHSPPPKVPAMILGVKGPSNQHCIAGGGGMREFAGFLRKCPKTFGQDCSMKQLGVLLLLPGQDASPSQDNEKEATRSITTPPGWDASSSQGT